jgi:hypothetical protein
MRLYNLTPIGGGWTWKDRVAEIIGQTLALVFVAPLVYAHDVSERVLSKILS